MTSTPRILVLGGGFAGLETAFLLRMRLRDRAGHHARVRHDQFMFRPNTSTCRSAPTRRAVVDLRKPFQRRNRLRAGRVAGVDPDAHEVSSPTGAASRTTSSSSRPAPTCRPRRSPGSPSTPRRSGRRSMLGVRGASSACATTRAPGEPQRVLFLVPPNNKCAGPLYEIVLMLETWLRRQDVREQVEITWSTFEQATSRPSGRGSTRSSRASSPSAAIDGHIGEVVTEVAQARPATPTAHARASTT